MWRVLTKIWRRYLRSSWETAAYLDDYINIDTELDSRQEQGYCSQTCSPVLSSTQPATEWGRATLFLVVKAAETRS